MHFFTIADYHFSTHHNSAITILVCLIINPASSQKATKNTKATYQKAAVMSYGSVEKGEGFKVFPSSVGAKAVLFTKASKGDKYKRRQLTSKGVKGSIGSSLSLPNITGKAGKGKSGKSGSISLKEAGLSIPEKEFRIFHHKHAGKSGKDAAAGLPSSSPSVSSVPSVTPSAVPSHEPSVQPSESPAPTAPSAKDTKARKLDGTPYPTFLPSYFPTEGTFSKSGKASDGSRSDGSSSSDSNSSSDSSSSSSDISSSSSDDYRRGRVMY